MHKEGNEDSTRLHELVGPADGHLAGVAVFRREMGREEQGSSYWEAQLEMELTLWSGRQMDALHGYLESAFTTLQFDADRAAAAVTDKTSVQCARMVFLLQKARHHREEEEEDAAVEVDDDVALREEDEADKATHAWESTEELNSVFYRRALKQYLTRVMSLIEVRFRTRTGQVRDDHVRNAVAQLKRRKKIKTLL